MERNDVIELLNGLLETARDGDYGFRTCAAEAEQAALKGILEARAVDCERAARDIEAAVVKLGGTPVDGGTASGALHRGWVTLRASVSAITDLGILEACERAEDKAVERYREALAQPLPPEVAAMVRRQHEGTRRNHDQIRALRDQMRAAKL